MQASKIKVGTEYAVYTGWGKPPALGSGYNVHRATVVSAPAKGTVEVKVGGTGQPLPLPTVKVMGTWEEHLAAEQARTDAKAVRNMGLLAEAAARNAAMEYLASVLGPENDLDGDGVLPWWADPATQKAKPHADWSGVFGGDTHGHLTAVDLAKYVKAGYEAGLKAGRAESTT